LFYGMGDIMALNLEAKIGQMLGVGFEGLESPEYLLRWLEAGRVGTLVLFGRNIESPQQVAALTQACHAASPTPLLIAIDQEGGLVTRLGKGFTQSPGAMVLGAADSDELAERVAGVMAAELRALGINWNLAPVLDLIHNVENPSVGTRSLGTSPARVASLGAAQIRGFQRGGVAATAKHFPSLGDTPLDTHVALARHGGSVEDLLKADLVPYREAVKTGVESIMVGHVVFEQLDPRFPATLSPAIVSELLREKIGFRGVSCTDDMEMKAVASQFGAGEAAVLAALAGQDVILFSHRVETQEIAYHALLNAALSGRLPIARIDAAVARIETMKARVAIREPLNPALIQTQPHLDVMTAAARAGMVLLRNGGEIPLAADGRGTLLVEFSSYYDTEAMAKPTAGMEQGGTTSLASRLRARAHAIDTISLLPDEITPEQAQAAKERAAQADLLIIATRNAQRLPVQRDVASALMALGKPVILLCLRAPFDVNVLPYAQTVLCTCGDSVPSLEAAADALVGGFVPLGALPVA
jgi:beta-N-acetylhexosaminidase